MYTTKLRDRNIYTTVGKIIAALVSRPCNEEIVRLIEIISQTHDEAYKIGYTEAEADYVYRESQAF